MDLDAFMLLESFRNSRLRWLERIKQEKARADKMENCIHSVLDAIEIEQVTVEEAREMLLAVFKKQKGASDVPALR